MKYIFLILLLCLTKINVLALKCYICSTSETDINKDCINNPEAVENGIRECNKKYCTSARIEYKETKGVVQSMSRNCEEKPLYLNEVIEDADITYRYYYRACKTDLCNGGSGRDTTNKDIYGDPALGILYVPGVGYSASSIQTVTKTLSFVILLGIIL